VRVVPDTSVVIDGRIMDFLSEHEDVEVIIPTALLAEVEHQANMGKATGFAALAELQKLREMADRGEITLSFEGAEPDRHQIAMAKEGAIDRLIRHVAGAYDAILLTGDLVQYRMARIEGIEAIYMEPRKEARFRIENYFDPKTMSVHLRAGLPPRRKRGRPGEFALEYEGDVLTEEDVREIARDIVERARRDPKSFIEIDEKGATVVQLREYRIAITMPPFSDAPEITAVRPVVKLSLEDYNLDERLLRRLRERAEGILVSGAPGAGKSTFVQAVAEYYASLNRIVKTMEKPRDLVLSNEITQYTALEGSMARTGDILLLVRPDYTVFDEMRTTDDFRVFADMRLAGVGMIGVVHASRAVDAIQRFVGRVELGMIPQIVDTVIHIEKGRVSTVLTLSYAVKVPSGMHVEDLARPVIEVRDFFTDQLLYELYTFGEQIVVVPVKGEGVSGVLKYAARGIEEEVRRLTGIPALKVEVLSENKVALYVPEDEIPHVIGQGGKRISALEKELGISVDVRPLGEVAVVPGEEFTPEVSMTKNTVKMRLPPHLQRAKVAIYADSEFLFACNVGSGGVIKVRKSTATGKMLMKALKRGARITVRTVD